MIKNILQTLAFASITSIFLMLILVGAAQITSVFTRKESTMPSIRNIIGIQNERLVENENTSTNVYGVRWSLQVNKGFKVKKCTGLEVVMQTKEAAERIRQNKKAIEIGQLFCDLMNCKKCEPLVVEVE